MATLSMMAGMPAMVRRAAELMGVDPAIIADDIPGTRKRRNLKEYSDIKFKPSEELLPKDMVPAAVMCPPADIKERVAAYLK